MAINSNSVFGSQASESELCTPDAKRKWETPVLSSFPAEKSEMKDVTFDLEVGDTVGPS